MKHLLLASQLDRLRGIINPSKKPVDIKAAPVRRYSPEILIGLMAPMTMVWLNLFMVGVAVPTIRNDFGIQSDAAAWLITVYTLAFMILMPMYGRLGDALGKRRLLLVGMIVFLAGTFINLLSPSLAWLIIGRVIQGIGAAGSIPLSLAIISQHFPPAQQGKAMGTWNSIGPVIGIAGPLISGLLIDYLGWRTIFAPTVLAGMVALWVVRKNVPTTPGYAKPGFLRTFDWGGALLLAATITGMLFYASSRSITGVASLQDWRLLALALLLLAVFLYWERRRKTPFVALGIFKHRTLTIASVCAGVRMFSMSGIGFLIPLYLTDVHTQSAATIGLMLMGYYGALLVTMPLGGRLADRWSSRWPVVIGLLIQAAGMVYYALLPSTVTWLWVMVGLVTQGLGAGVSVAALHRAAMVNISQEQMGMAAGLYSMIRYSGTVFGTALGGVLLQRGLDQFLPPVEAYQAVFLFIAGVAFLGSVIGVGLKE